MSIFSITIQHWAAWIPGISSRADWQLWLQGEKLTQAGATPDLVQIPALLRRRLSPLGKMALSVAWSVIPSAETKLSAVFASRHGELERTVAMLQSIAAAETASASTLSPTQFSLSVHNAIGGVHSIARKDFSAITALAVGDEGLNLALMEAGLILAESEAGQALCVIYDEPLPEPYSDPRVGPARPFALALIVSRNDLAADGSVRLTLNLVEKDEVEQQRDELQALSFIRYLLTPEQESLWLPGLRHDWCWTRSGGAV